ALNSNTTANYNTATGVNALLANTAGNGNTANGVQTLQSNTTGIGNTATGVNALLSNTTGDNNAASGRHALYYNTTGSNNIALGTNAGVNLTTGSNNIDIGNHGIAGESSAVRIGTAGAQTNTFIAGIAGVAVTGSPVAVNSSGQLGVAPSSARFKEQIEPMDRSSEAILFLKPVTFRYKEELDPDKIPQFGLVAEEVEKVNPDLVARGEDGKVMTVRYDAVNAMLLNEFLKEHRKVEEQQSAISELKAALAKQQKQIEGQNATAIHQRAQIEALTAGLQKVTARVESSNPDRRVAGNN